MKRTIHLALLAVLSLALALPATAGKQKPPQTGFEKSGGADWTTHEQELEFLAAVDEMSARVEIDVIGTTLEKRPLHLVKIGDPAPVSSTASQRRPTIMMACSQHGNEPAGREACLKFVRDLAFTNDPDYVSLMKDATILVVPSANPDGRAANTRENSQGIDINRDHVNLVTAEARAIAGVVRDWQPEVSLDLHEYGPSIPAAYDDEVLYLWPRNLNTDQKVYERSRELGAHIKESAEEAGYTADEYGQYSVAEQDVHQSAGDGDEGIMRNAMGLRHSVGILVETAVTEDPRNGPQEVNDPAAVQLRRVDAHMVVIAANLGFMGQHGVSTAKITAGARVRKTKEGRNQSAPVYFGGADNQEPTAEQTQDPPPCAYKVSSADLKKMRRVFRLLGIKWSASGLVSLGQPAEPLIPLLLDERGLRHSVAAKPIEKC